MAAGLEPFDRQLALRLAALEALPVRQNHRADGRGDQQCAGQLECPQIWEKISAARPWTLPPALACVNPAKPGGNTADAGDEHDAESQTGHHSGNPLSAQRLHQRLRGVHADQHQHEQEQHHHRAGVDHDLHNAEEHGVFDHVEHRQDDHRHRQGHRAVDRVGGHHHAQRPDQRQRAQHPEGHRFTGGRAGERVGGQQSGHFVTSEFGLSRRPSEVMLPR